MTTETKTYEDGSQRVGAPPFPKLSPKEEHEAALRGDLPEQAESGSDSKQAAGRARKPKAQG